MDQKKDKAFNDIKNYWSEALELHTPVDGERFLLETCASDVGLGAALRQK